MAPHTGLARPQGLAGDAGWAEETEVVRRYLEAVEARREEFLSLDRPATGSGDVVGLEEAFVAVAARYGRREHLSYAAWRAAGVASDVLHRAGITRAR